MATEIKVPTLGESVTEATVAKWFKAKGDAVELDEPLLELETDKVTLEVNAPAAGMLAEIIADEGAEVEVGSVLGRIAEGKAGTATKAPPVKTDKPDPDPVDAAPASAPTADSEAAPLSPAVRRLVDENDLDPAAIPATGKGGRLVKEDVVAWMARKDAAPAKDVAPAKDAAPAPAAAPRETGPREERVKMSRLRRRVAERLKEAQNNAAMLTTFNEVDMSQVMALRAEYKDRFEKRHGIKLGFMSFFVRACIAALKEYPAVNAEIDGDEIIYRNYCDIGVAVGSGQGLVVPVMRDVEAMGFAEIEAKIVELGTRANNGSLTMAELTGGTFTISNGGVYGSLLSTPILNPPQSGILGMHKIEERAVAIKGEVVVRPMMYLALSYDHRIVDGREAVGFLVRVKEAIDDPRRLLLDI